VKNTKADAKNPHPFRYSQGWISSTRPSTRVAADGPRVCLPTTTRECCSFFHGSFFFVCPMSYFHSQNRDTVCAAHPRKITPPAFVFRSTTYAQPEPEPKPKPLRAAPSHPPPTHTHTSTHRCTSGPLRPTGIASCLSIAAHVGLSARDRCGSGCGSLTLHSAPSLQALQRDLCRRGRQ
jgi:hypothetical protein